MDITFVAARRRSSVGFPVGIMYRIFVVLNKGAGCLKIVLLRLVVQSRLLK